MGRPPVNPTGPMTPAERQARSRARRRKSINRRARTRYKIANESEAKQEKRERREANLAASAQRMRAAQALHSGAIPLCNVILVDFPSHHHNWSSETGSDRAAENTYGTMVYEEIAAFPLLDPSSPHCIIAPDCIIYQWAPNPLLNKFMALLDRWGFQYSQTHVGHKDSLGTGKRAIENAEFLIVGVRGAMAAPLPEDKLPYMLADVFDMPRLRHLHQPHSIKPSIVAEHINLIYPPPLVRIELFSRPKVSGDYSKTGLYTPLPLSAAFRPGWWHWGDEVPGGLRFMPPIT